VRALLANPRVRIYLGGQLFTLFGDTMLFLAMGIWVKTLTGSSAAAGLTFFFLAAPALLAPLAGMVVDRVRRRPLLVAVNLALAAAVLPLLLVHDADQLWLIYAVMLVYGAGNQVVASAQTALLPALVADEHLGQANSLLSLIRQGLRLIAPLIGAGLFAAAGARVVILADAATFLLAATGLVLIRVDEPAGEARTAGWWATLGEGVQYIRATPVLRQLVVAFTVGFAVIGLLETVAFAVAAALGRPPAFLGVLVSAQGVGAVAVGLTAPPAMRRLGEGRLAAAGLLTCAAAIGALVLPVTAVAVTAMAVLGGGITATVIGANTLVQRRTPSRLLGRVDAAAEAAVTLPQTAFIGLGAALVAAVDYRVLLAGTAGLMLATGSWLFTRPAQRSLLQAGSNPTPADDQRPPPTAASAPGPASNGLTDRPLSQSPVRVGDSGPLPEHPPAGLPLATVSQRPAPRRAPTERTSRVRR